MPTDKAQESAPAPEKPSPWLLAPVFTSNPKLGTTLGATAGYLTRFDEKSRPSMFATTLQYSSTDSIVAGAFARTSYDEDRQRLNIGMTYGNIKNDYTDYLGTGVPLKNNAELRSGILRYLYRVSGDWFIGVQGIYQNFTIAGATAFDEQVLDVLGVAPYKSGGLGVVGYYDSRDNDFKPSRGWVVSLNNLAYREALGGANNFDVYRADFRHYIPHGDGNVFALRQLNHLTSDAPTQNLAPVQLRGYKTGQYTGKYVSQFEGEERFKLAQRWTATLFAALSCTYGNGKSCSDNSNLFPMAGAGVQYILKPEVGIVLNLEYAQGKAGNSGVILKTGYTF
ncbi:hypothetical protein VVD49_16415 [Uliginosibacterium sp. H3]|uniref:Bacterial surface antigen (D15) domain-containing protein n=1 Tax=Uliginosibacterium silvisoli TaxID=3114758 RepID=A0ABU6K8J4_9RHOO|nr:hypothetical protein [Uliginosibacterium sp. H3]